MTKGSENNALGESALHKRNLIRKIDRWIINEDEEKSEDTTLVSGKWLIDWGN